MYIIHIGVHKTGSTAIQRWADRSRNQLLEHKILYPLAGRPHIASIAFGHHAIPWFLNNRVKVANPFPSLINESRHYADSNVLLSSEEFARLESSQISQLAEMIGADVQIIVYLRPQQDVLQGLYGTDIVYNGEKRDIFIYALDLEHVLDFSALIARWCDVFGAEKIILRPYDRRSFPSRNVVADFVENVICIDFESLSNYEFQDENPSLPWFFSQAIQHMWRLNINKNLIYKVIERMRVVTKTKDLSTCYSFLSPSESKNLQSKYLDSNKALRSQYQFDIDSISTTCGQSESEWRQERHGSFRAVEISLALLLEYQG